MSNNHLIQYFIIAVIIVAVIVFVAVKLCKLQKCNSPEDICECCSSKSMCGKAKKNRKKAEAIAKSKK